MTANFKSLSLNNLNLNQNSAEDLFCSSPPGNFAKPDDQGKLDTCSRFALAKALVDGFMRKFFVPGQEIDIDQDAVTVALLQKHKSVDGVWPHEFDQETYQFIDNESRYWESFVRVEKLQDFRDFIKNISLTPRQNTYVLVYPLDPNKPKDEKHCVYAEDYDQTTLEVSCINSDPKVPRLTITVNKPYVIFYKVSCSATEQNPSQAAASSVASSSSLSGHASRPPASVKPNYTVSTSSPMSQRSTILLSSTGDAAEWNGGLLGLYEEFGQHKGVPRYRQLNTLDDSKQNLFYKEATDNVWGVGDILDGDFELRNRHGGSGSLKPPMTGWEHLKGKKGWVTEPQMKVHEIVPSLCEAVSISISGKISPNFPREVLGKYIPTGIFSAGRQVFKHETEEKFLLILQQSKYICWKVSNNMENTSEDILESGSCPSMCPADPRAKRSQKRQRNCWIYKDTKNSNWIRNDTNINISCDTHKPRV